MNLKNIGIPKPKYKKINTEYYILKMRWRKYEDQ